MRVAVNPEVLNWAVEYSQKSIGAFQKKFPKFDQWLDKTVQPTIGQLEELAAFAHVPFGYLLLPYVQGIPIVPIKDFRTRDHSVQEEHLYSPELRDTIFAMRERQDWLRDYKKRQGYQPVPFVGQLRKDIPEAEFVRLMRKELKTTDDWRTDISSKEEAFRYFLHLVEMTGVIVFVNGVVGNNTFRKLNVKEFRGFALVDSYAPLIFINGADAPAGRLFTLIHELVHIFLGQDGLDDGNEVFCNRIAARFLVPQAEFTRQWTVLSKDFDALESFFKVSKLVLYRVAFSYGKISRAEWQALTEAYYQEVNKRKQQNSGGSYYNSIPYKMGGSFSRYVFESVQAGTTLYKEAYHLLGLNGKTYAKAMKLVEG